MVIFGLPLVVYVGESYQKKQRTVVMVRIENNVQGEGTAVKMVSMGVS
jgi:hypothetical protein